MILLTSPQKIYITLLIIGIAVFLTLLFILLYRLWTVRKVNSKLVASKLYRFANMNDYLLLNDYRINIDDVNVGKIDHILVTNKYIYVIHDYSYYGVISGLYFDEQLKLTNSKGERNIANPLNYNRNLAKRLALSNGLDNTFIKGIVVVADQSTFKIDELPAQFNICRLSKLIKTIKEMDGNEVKPFKEETIVKFINYLSKENDRK